MAPEIIAGIKTDSITIGIAYCHHSALLMSFVELWAILCNLEPGGLNGKTTIFPHLVSPGWDLISWSRP